VESRDKVPILPPANRPARGSFHQRLPQLKKHRNPTICGKAAGNLSAPRGKCQKLFCLPLAPQYFCQTQTVRHQQDAHTDIGSEILS